MAPSYQGACPTLAVLTASKRTRRLVAITAYAKSFANPTNRRHSNYDTDSNYNTIPSSRSGYLAV